MSRTKLPIYSDNDCSLAERNRLNRREFINNCVPLIDVVQNRKNIYDFNLERIDNKCPYLYYDKGNNKNTIIDNRFNLNNINLTCDPQSDAEFPPDGSIMINIPPNIIIPNYYMYINHKNNNMIFNMFISMINLVKNKYQEYINLSDTIKVIEKNIINIKSKLRDLENANEKLLFFKYKNKYFVRLFNHIRRGDNIVLTDLYTKVRENIHPDYIITQSLEEVIHIIMNDIDMNDIKNYKYVKKNVKQKKNWIEKLLEDFIYLLNNYNNIDLLPNYIVQLKELEYNLNVQKYKRSKLEEKYSDLLFDISYIDNKILIPINTNKFEFHIMNSGINLFNVSLTCGKFFDICNLILIQPIQSVDFYIHALQHVFRGFELQNLLGLMSNYKPAIGFLNSNNDEWMLNRPIKINEHDNNELVEQNINDLYERKKIIIPEHEEIINDTNNELLTDIESPYTLRPESRIIEENTIYKISLSEIRNKYNDIYNCENDKCSNLNLNNIFNNFANVIVTIKKLFIYLNEIMPDYDKIFLMSILEYRLRNRLLMNTWPFNASFINQIVHIQANEQHSNINLQINVLYNKNLNEDIIEIPPVYKWKRIALSIPTLNIQTTMFANCVETACLNMLISLCFTSLTKYDEIKLKSVVKNDFADIVIPLFNYIHDTPSSETMEVYVLTQWTSILYTYIENNKTNTRGLAFGNENKTNARSSIYNWLIFYFVIFKDIFIPTNINIQDILNEAYEDVTNKLFPEYLCIIYKSYTENIYKQIYPECVIKMNRTSDGSPTLKITKDNIEIVNKTYEIIITTLNNHVMYDDKILNKLDFTLHPIYNFYIYHKHYINHIVIWEDTPIGTHYEINKITEIMHKILNDNDLLIEFTYKNKFNRHINYASLPTYILLYYTTNIIKTKKYMFELFTLIIDNILNFNIIGETYDNIFFPNITEEQSLFKILGKRLLNNKNQANNIEKIYNYFNRSNKIIKSIINTLTNNKIVDIFSEIDNDYEEHITPELCKLFIDINDGNYDLLQKIFTDDVMDMMYENVFRYESVFKYFIVNKIKTKYYIIEGLTFISYGLHFINHYTSPQTTKKILNFLFYGYAYNTYSLLHKNIFNCLDIIDTDEKLNGLFYYMYTKENFIFANIKELNTTFFFKYLAETIINSTNPDTINRICVLLNHILTSECINLSINNNEYIYETNKLLVYNVKRKNYKLFDYFNNNNQNIDINFERYETYDDIMSYCYAFIGSYFYHAAYELLNYSFNLSYNNAMYINKFNDFMIVLKHIYYTIIKDISLSINNQHSKKIRETINSICKKQITYVVKSFKIPTTYRKNTINTKYIKYASELKLMLNDYFSKLSNLVVIQSDFSHIKNISNDINILKISQYNTKIPFITNDNIQLISNPQIQNLYIKHLENLPDIESYIYNELIQNQDIHFKLQIANVIDLVKDSIPNNITIYDSIYNILCKMISPLYLKYINTNSPNNFMLLSDDIFIMNYELAQILYNINDIPIIEPKYILPSIKTSKIKILPSLLYSVSTTSSLEFINLLKTTAIQDQDVIKILYKKYIEPNKLNNKLEIEYNKIINNEFDKFIKNYRNMTVNEKITLHKQRKIDYLHEKLFITNEYLTLINNIFPLLKLLLKLNIFDPLSSQKKLLNNIYSILELRKNKYITKQIILEHTLTEINTITIEHINDNINEDDIIYERDEIKSDNDKYKLINSTFINILNKILISTNKLLLNHHNNNNEILQQELLNEQTFISTEEHILREHIQHIIMNNKENIKQKLIKPQLPNEEINELYTIYQTKINRLLNDHKYRGIIDTELYELNHEEQLIIHDMEQQEQLQIEHIRQLKLKNKKS